MKNKSFVIGLFCLFSISCFAQQKAIQNSIGKANEIIHSTTKKIKQQANEKSKTKMGGFFDMDVKHPTKSLSILAQANSNGWSGGLQLAKKKSEKLTNAYTVTFAEIKADKEEKLKSTMLEVKGYGKPLAYIYGKQNSFYQLNMGCERQRILLKGIIEENVNVAIVYGANISIGLVKPYYLKLKHPVGNGFTLQDEKYSTSNADTFLLTNSIYSRSSAFYHWQETKVNLGLQLYVASQIDIGKSEVFTKAIRFGASASVFSQKIPILINQNDKNIFLNLFMRIVIGKGW